MILIYTNNDELIVVRLVQLLAWCFSWRNSN